MFKILEKYQLAPRVHFALIEAPLIANKAQAGQFVIVRVRETGERVPLTIADYDRSKGTVSLVFQSVGKTTCLFSNMKAGEFLPDFLGPQGNPTEIKNYGTVVVIGGGIGIAPVYPLARALKQAGNKVIAIIGYRSKEFVFWEDKMRSVSDELIIGTNDGSYGKKGIVTDFLNEIFVRGEKIGHIFAIGPAIMMKAIADQTRGKGIPTVVSLNSLMVCGMGMCGACRVTVDNKTKFTCMDGPDFDAHKVDFEELMKRLDTYKEEEVFCKDHE